MWALVQGPAGPLPIWFFTNVLGKATEDALRGWAPATTWDGTFSPSLVIAVIWGVGNQ